ncbi:MAG: NAD-dependent epimerase/dehydratase family protein [Actinomycetota bacterium]
MRAVVTGGAGFIGSHLSERLHEAGHDVLVIDDLSSGEGRVPILAKLGISFERADIREESAAAAIRSYRPEAVCHLAAQIDVRRSVADPVHDASVNVLGTLRILEAARACGARVLFASSGGTIYGEVPPEHLPAGEETIGRPTAPYGITKRVAEDYLRFFGTTYGLPFVSLALANVYGPRQDPHGEAGVVAIFTSKLLAGEPCVVYGDGGQTRDFVFVDDVVDAFVAALDRGTGETVNIGTGIETTVNDLYERIAAICGVGEPASRAPERAGELRQSALDARKAERVLDWRPATSLDDGLARTVEWFRENARAS